MEAYNTGSTRLELLTRSNYDTWRIKVEALLIKNQGWKYVNGTKVKPELAENEATSSTALNKWIEEDSVAKSDLILSISPPLLKTIRNCKTSRDVWLKLESAFASKGPAKKASLWKQLTSHQLQESGDTQEHTDQFFEIVDKLSEMSIDINEELQSLMLLHSLPNSYDNFRCAIESRDKLPDPEALRIKILDESQTRKGKASDNDSNAVLYTHRNYKKQVKPKPNWKSNDSKPNDWKPKNRDNFKYKCHKCKKRGHMAASCPLTKDQADLAERVCSFAYKTEYALQVKAEENNNGWCIDSGCTVHLCKDYSMMKKIEPSEPGKLNLANNMSTDIKAKGKVIIPSTNGIKPIDLHLENALYVPELRTNLISVAKLTDRNYNVLFERNRVTVCDKQGKAKLEGNRIGDLYYLKERKQQANVVTINKSNMQIWHERFGHLNGGTLLDMVRGETALDIGLKGNEVLPPCSSCIQGKLTSLPFPKNAQRSSTLLEIVHTDICGPMRIKSKGGAKYLITFIDDHSRWCEVQFLRNKSDAFRAFQEYKAQVERQTGYKIKFLQSDNGKEFVNQQFDDLLRKEGIKRRLTVTYTPQQNGVAERKNRTLTEMARCMLIAANLPESFWAEAMQTANYIRNRCASRSLEQRTPFELWVGRRPRVRHLRIFGEKGFILDKSPSKGKFEPRGKECIFLGYDNQSKAYRVWLPREHKLVAARDVKFVNEFSDHRSFREFMPDHHSNPKENLNEEEHTTEIGPNTDSGYQPDALTDGNNSIVPEEEEIDTPRDDSDNPQPGRGRGRPKKVYTGKPGRPRKEYQPPQTSHSEEGTEFAQLAEVPWKQAMDGPQADEWKDALETEIRSLLEHETFEIADRPSDRTVIGCRTVLRNKYSADGEIERRKARIVAQGFSQRPGIDFHDTFAPVARLGSLRLLIGLAIRHDMDILQLDITTAYLNSKLDEELYMEKPGLLEEILERIISKESKGKAIRLQAEQILTLLNKGDKVCKLRKSLYGLKQSGRQWHATLDEELQRFGLKPTKSDPCVYTLKRGGDWLYALIYVDDILIFTRNPELSKQLKQGLTSKFKVRDLGNLKYCLGIEVKREKDKISLSQRGYILDILNRFGMKEAKPISTPMSLGTKLSFCTKLTDSDEKKSKIRALPYRELMGALNYLAMATRPDIAHAVSYFSQFQNNYDETHWRAAKRVLRYLRGTLDFGLTYSRDSNPIKGFADADWGGCIVDRKSYSGYAFCLGGAAISWSSTKQKTVALSSTEAEYVSLSEASKEAMFLQGFLRELHFGELSEICIAGDNQGALFLAKNPIFHNRTKHIDLRHHFMRDAIKEGRVTVEYLPTELMPADVLTKPLPGPKHVSCSLALGVTLGGRGVANATKGEVLEFVAPATPPDRRERLGPLP